MKATLKCKDDGVEQLLQVFRVISACLKSDIPIMHVNFLKIYVSLVGFFGEGGSVSTKKNGLFQWRMLGLFSFIDLNLHCISKSKCDEKKLLGTN